MLDKLQWHKKDIKILIFITQGSNYVIPSTAFFLHKRLELCKDCVAFDVNLGCSSFNVGVHIVSALLQNCQQSDKALLLIGDTAAQVLRPETNIKTEVIADQMIFGSAGAAIAMEKVEQHKIRFFTKSDGTGFDAIIRHKDRPTAMDGEKVFEFAINDVSDDVKSFKKHFDLKEEDIDYYVFHQAQKLILDNIADNCKIPENKELRSLCEYGNTSGTSVAVSICANIDKFADKDNVKFFLCGFGVGLSWGGVYTEIPTKNILPIIETDEHYDEDKLPDSDLQDKCILVMDADRGLGEFMSCYVKEQTASVVMAGMDIRRMKEVQKDFILESHVVEINERNTAFRDVISYCQEKKLEFDGIIFPEQTCDMKQYVDDIRLLQCAGLLKEKCSLVFISDIEGFKEIDKKRYLQAKARLENDIDLLSEGLTEKQRINAVMYDSSKLELVDIIGSGGEWMTKYLQLGCPEKMARQIYIGRAVKYLLSDESAYSTGMIM